MKFEQTAGCRLTEHFGSGLLRDDIIVVVAGVYFEELTFDRCRFRWTSIVRSTELKLEEKETTIVALNVQCESTVRTMFSSSSSLSWSSLFTFFDGLDFSKSSLRYSRLVASFQVLSSRTFVTRGNRMEIPFAVCCFDLENSAPCNESEEHPPFSRSDSDRATITVISQIGDFFGSMTRKSGSSSRLICNHLGIWLGFFEILFMFGFKSTCSFSNVASSNPLPHFALRPI